MGRLVRSTQPEMSGDGARFYLCSRGRSNIIILCRWPSPASNWRLRCPGSISNYAAT